MSSHNTVEISREEYEALLADASRYTALRTACLRRAAHKHHQWLEILLQIPLGDPTYQASTADIDYAVDEAFGLLRSRLDSAAAAVADAQRTAVDADRLARGDRLLDSH